MGQILILDPSKVLRSQWGRALSKDGFQVVEAESGNQMFYRLMQEKIDCIVLDLYLDHEHGYHLIKRLKRDPKYTDIPVIVASEERRRASIEEVLGLGVADYVLKPVPSTVLVNRVRRVLHQIKYA